MSQPTDSQTGDRPLKQEADDIKQAIIQNDLANSKSTDKTSTVHVNFTSLAQSVIPGNVLRKRLGRQINVEYIPDFYYMIELCQLIFISAKKDRSLKKDDTSNIHCFTLYVAHTLLYVYLKTVQDCNDPAVDLDKVLSIYENAGFGTNMLPTVCSQWVDGLGNFLDPQTKRTFLPKFPVLGTGAFFESGFFSASTGHLLPNIYCLLSLCRISADRSTGLQLLTSPAMQNRAGIFGSVSAHQPLVNSTLCRSNALRVPGGKALGVMCSDTELIQIVEDTISTTFTDLMQNLLKLSPALLAHLKRSQEILFLQIENFNLKQISPIGTSLCILPLIFIEPQAIVTPEHNSPAVPGPPVVGAMHYESEFDHNSRISTRNEIVNGHVDYAYQTPIVRICNNNDSIVIPGYTFADPQSPWYLQQLEFDTQPATLNDTRAYFIRKG
jgi:hypothetical protein